MATTTSRLVLRKPQDSSPDDAVNVVTDISDNMQKIDDSVGAFRSTSFPGSPFLGQLRMRSDQADTVFAWNGTKWIPLNRGTQVDVEVQDNTDRTTISTSYTNITALSTTFTAPHSGNVYVTLSSRMETTGTPATGYTSFEIRLDNVSGSVVWAADDNIAMRYIGSPWVTLGIRKRVTGLTPYTQTYYIQMMHRSVNASSTLQVSQRKLLVEHIVEAV